MKSDHRHELKTNELAEWLSHLPEWTKENIATIIMVCVVISVGIGIYAWRVYNFNVVRVREHAEFTVLLNQLASTKMQISQAQAQNQGRDPSFMLLPPAKSLQTFAQNTKNDRMAALALIKRAEALRAEVHFGNVEEQYFTSQTNEAKNSYIEALQRCPDEPSLAAAAKLGLGLCEEELGNFKQARQIYQEIVSNPDFEPTIATAQAKYRIATMADYKRKIAFGPAPKPTAATQPATQIKPPAPSQPRDIITPFNINRPLDLDLNFPAAPNPPAEANTPGGS
jgi:tetratricopeptide (TPR) repeat protein